MANTATLATMRLRAQRRSDLVSSSIIVAAEWLDYINEGGAELHDLIVNKFENYVLSNTTQTLTSGTDTYTLPTTFHKVVGMDWESGTIRYPLRRYMFTERNNYRMDPQVANPDGQYYRYNIEGTSFRLIPIPSASGTIRIWYVPQYVQLSGDSDVVASYVSNGWEQVIVLTAAIKAIVRLERDPAALMAEKAELVQRIINSATARDAGEPARIVDMDGWY